MIVQTCVNDISMSVEFLDEISLTTFDAALLKKKRIVWTLRHETLKNFGFFYPTFSNPMQIEALSSRQLKMCNYLQSLEKRPFLHKN